MCLYSSATSLERHKDAVCMDVSPSCADWAGYDLCETEPVSMTSVCPATCGLCGIPVMYVYIVGVDSTYAVEVTKTLVFALLGDGSLELIASQNDSLSVGCSYCAYVVHEDVLYMAGHGSSSSPNTLKTSTFQPSQTHTSLPSLPASTQTHEEPFTFILTGRQYVGGFITNEVYSRSLSNPDSWRREADLPGSMSYTARSGVVAQGVAYITGGKLDGATTNTAWSWSPGQAAWQQLPSMEHTHESHCNTLVNDRDIYVLGGFSSGSGDSRSIEVYNIPTRSWALRSPAPYRLAYPACSSVGKDVYVNAKSLMYRYDTEQDTWSVLYNPGHSPQYITISDGSAMLIV